MNVGILGSGVVAKAFGAGFIKHGHSVMLGTRDAAKLAGWAQSIGAQVGSFADAAGFGTLLVLAVKGSAAENVLRLAGGGLDGKVVMDPTNPIADAPPVNGVLRFFTSLDDSLMERLQKAHPTARFVKAFNSVGNTQMVNPTYAGGKPTMFICGNDDAAKARGRRPLRRVRLGNARPRSGRGGTRNRTSLHPVVHPGLSEKRMDARIQGVARVNGN